MILVTLCNISYMFSKTCYGMMNVDKFKQHELDAGGKLSTWFPPGRLVEHQCIEILIFSSSSGNGNCTSTEITEQVYKNMKD